VILFGSGLLILTTPQISIEGKLQYIFSLALLLSVLIDLWGFFRQEGAMRYRRQTVVMAIYALSYHGPDEDNPLNRAQTLSTFLVVCRSDLMELA